jgi:CDP-6-deoxy-D-xylo-4-hexulose-3-dehydrase
MEGGHVVTDDEELYHILLTLRAHGWTRDLPKNNRICSKDDNPFVESFRFILPGYNVRPLELEGAIGIEQLKKIPSFIEGRRKNAEKFQQIMHSHSDLMIQQEIGNSSWFGFSLVIRNDSDITREELINNLTLFGFESRPIVAGNFSRSESIKYFDYEVPFKMKNAEYIENNGLFIGNHHYPMDEVFEALAQIL